MGQRVPILIRSAKPEDAPDIVRINILGWQTAYQNIYPADKLAQLNEPAEIERRIKLSAEFLSSPPKAPYLVAEKDGKIVGISGCVRNKKPESEQHYEAEVKLIYVDPDYFRLGIGRQLIAASVEGFIGLGWRGLIIWSLIENPYRKFYEALGGEILPYKADFTAFETAKPLISYGWRDFQSLINNCRQGV